MTPANIYGRKRSLSREMSPSESKTNRWHRAVEAENRVKDARNRLYGLQQTINAYDEPAILLILSPCFLFFSGVFGSISFISDPSKKPQLFFFVYAPLGAAIVCFLGGLVQHSILKKRKKRAYEAKPSPDEKLMNVRAEVLRAEARLRKIVETTVESGGA